MPLVDQTDAPLNQTAGVHVDWSTTVPLSHAALGLDIAAAASGGCEVHAKVVGLLHRAETAAFLLVLQGDRVVTWDVLSAERPVGWLAGPTGSDGGLTYNVTYGAVPGDFRFSLALDWTHDQLVADRLDGNLRILVGGNGLQPVADEGNASISLGLACTGVPRYTLSISREFLMFDRASIQQGAWISANGDVTETVGGHASQAFTAPLVQVFAYLADDGTNLQAGDLSIRAPTFSVLLQFGTAAFHAEGGPGDYGFFLNRTAAPSPQCYSCPDFFWGIAIGLKAVDSLDDIAAA